MISEEAKGLYPPQEGLKRSKSKNKSIKSNKRSYNWVVYAMFILLTLLCSYNLIIYNSYREYKNQYNSTFDKAKTIMAENSNLNNSSFSLKNENSSIKNEYQKIQEENANILKLIDEIKKQNEELEKKNNELADDNIELQNSLKKAASVGIKPQNFTEFNGISSRGEIERGQYAGRFLGTAYTPSKEECGNDKGITNSGEPIIPGISLAVDGKYWPFGTVFYIKGLGYAVAMDTGSAIKGKNRFDFAVFNQNFAMALGSRYWDVYVVKIGNGSVGAISF